ncbi:peritrophin-48-like [Teleopsis dalmanni]|uniref:peritrophin-48-like n=1 Tax=Teleopsis dalmanni TaxID=139649 RepID=UPI0018CDFF54|nr:peritrophin-48-like [Teleopsis dalmanni]
MFLIKSFSATLFLCFILAGNTKADFDPNLICELLPDNTKIRDPRACNAWIECTNNEAVSGTCDGELFYDRETEECVSPDSIKCISSNPCAATAGTDGFVADPYSCNGYYYCSAGNAAHGECSSGMNFNPGTQDCIRNFPCPAKLNPDSYCNIVPDGVFIKNSTDCIGWQMCWQGVVINGTCPDYFYFNRLTSKCDYPQNVDCIQPTTEPPTMPAGESCTNINDFISDGYSCNGYFLCRSLKAGTTDDYDLVHGVCDNGRFFSPENGGACVNRTQIYCPYNRCVDIGYGGIKLVNESSDDCTGFALCQNGEQISAGTCPDGEYFNEVTQLCTTEVISFPACALSAEETTTEPTTIVTE